MISMKAFLAIPHPPVDLLLPRTNMTEFCTTLPPVGRGAAYVAIQQPIDLGPESLRGVRGIYALAPFRCRTPAPSVEELFLSHNATIDEHTARCFPRLVNVSIESQQTLQLAWFDNDRLRGISLSDRAISDWPVLRSMSPWRLNLSWTAMPLEHLPASVRWLSLLRLGPLSQKRLGPIWLLPALESLRLMNVQLGTLDQVARIASLTELSVWSTKSFSGISRLKRLRSFHASGIVCPPISELTANVALRDLQIKARTPPTDLAKLGRLAGLERLTLWFGDIHRPADIESLSFLRSLGNLRELGVHGVRLRDRDVTPINDLSGLKVLDLSGAFGPEIRRLKGRRGRKTTVTKLVPALGGRTAPVRPRLISGTWTIFEDVSSLLGVGNNYDAEKAVRRRLKTVAPEVAACVEFDSEADSFCVRAESRKDLDRIARVIRTMVKEERVTTTIKGS